MSDMKAISGGHRPGLAKSHLLALLVPVAIIGLAGCSATDLAETEVCSAQADVSQSYDALIADVKAGNFGDAKDELDDLSAAIGDLDTANQSLNEANQEEIQAEIDQLNAALASFGDVRSMEDLGRALDESAAQLQSVIDATAIAADC